MTPDPKLEAFIRKSGAELEAAVREAGTSLPEGVSGETLVRSFLEDMEKEHFSPEGQARAKHIEEIAREVAAELPGGPKNPDFADRFLARLKASLNHLVPVRPHLPNQRLKLSARGGRVVGNGSVLSAAAAGRSLSAIR